MELKVDVFVPESFPDSILVKKIWRIETKNCKGEIETILPKGTAEIIFNPLENTKYFSREKAVPYDLPPCFINGLNTFPKHLIKGNNQYFLGIQLFPHALPLLFHTSAGEFIDKVIDGTKFCPKLALVAKEIGMGTDFLHQVSIQLAWVRAKFQTMEKRILRYQRFFEYMDFDSQNHETLQTLCRDLNLSDRQLRRVFNETIGIPTDEFLLYKKYLRALTALHFQKDSSLTCIAMESGFYDQAHFIHEFKRFTGLTPGAYRKAMSIVPGHLFERQKCPVHTILV